MERMMGGGQGQEDEAPPSGPSKVIGEDEDFMFEKYLKSGEYLDITKRKR